MRNLSVLIVNQFIKLYQQYALNHRPHYDYSTYTNLVNSTVHRQRCLTNENFNR